MLYSRQRGNHHPAPWELHVQSYLRDLRTPVPPNEALLLGFDGSELVAVIYFGFAPDDAQFMIWCVACAVGKRRRGHGREAVARALDVMRATKVRNKLDCGVFTKIDPRNEGSRRLFRASGFEYLNNYEGYEVWVADV